MWVKILLFFFVFSFLFRTDHSFDQDLGRHLKLGEIILQTKSVPLVNLFSYTHPDYPFINSHWLFEVLVYLGQQTIGLQALLVLKVVIILLAVWLVLSTVPKKQYLLLPVGFIFLHTLRERPEFRPEILSFFFTALTYYILDRFEKVKSRLIFLLPVTQLIWVNTHIYFFVGLVLQAIFLLHLSWQHLRFHLEGGKLKLLAIVFVLSVALSLINPNGLSGFLYPFNVTKNYGYTIVENQTIFFLENIGFRDPNFLFVKLAVAIITLSVVLAFFRKRLAIKNLGLAGLGATLALLNVRSFPYLALLTLPAVLENFGRNKLTVWTKILIFLTIPILLYESLLYLNGDYYKYTDSYTKPRLEFKESARYALDFVLANDLPQPIFNNFDIGSYITYRGWPKYRVFVDGRPEGYPKDFFQQTYIPTQYDYSKFQDLNKIWDFKTIIFSHTDQTPWGKAFLTSVVKDDSWKIVYIDDFMLVLVKNDIADEKNLAIIDLSKLNGAEAKFDNHRSYLNLSVFLLSTGNPQSALTFAANALRLFPKSPVGNSIFEGLTGQKFYPGAKNNFWW